MVWQFLGGGSSVTPEISQTNGQPTELIFWGTYDDPAVFQPIITAYQAQHPGVTVRYVRQDPSLYEFISLNQLATQEGPDIWMIPSEWLPKHHDKFSPLPNGFLAAQNLPTPKKKLFGKSEPTPDDTALYKQFFAPVTVENNVSEDSVTVLPLSVDTLGLYANSELLAKHDVKTMPRTWEEIVAAATKIANRQGMDFTQPAIALGTSNNVTRASEILATLLMQSHTPMLDEAKQSALYNQSIAKSTGEPVQPGPIALDFYTSFASPTKENYSWSANQPQDFDAFLAGQLPMMIDYSYRVNDIRQKTPNFPLATSALPQVSLTDRPLTLGTSLMIGVPSVSKHPNQAWDFIKFLTNEENSYAYARAAGRPPARLKLVSAPASDPALQPFVAQTNYAVNWYRNEIGKTNTVFRQAIDAVLAGQPVTSAIDKLAKQVSHILRNESYE